MAFYRGGTGYLAPVMNRIMSDLDTEATNRAATGQATAAAKFGLGASKQRFAWEEEDRAKAVESAAGVGDSMAKMIENYNLAYGQAKAENEARYQEQLSIADQTTGQRMADVRSDFGRRGADITQQQNRLGMGNTTVGASLQAGNLREMQSSLNRTADQMQQTKLGIIGGREDTYPDLGSLQSTLAGAASGKMTPQVAAMLKAFGNIRSF